jgi:hypothetical protein
MEGHWSHRAVTDLRIKVESKLVRQYLVEVSRTSLHRHCPEWGGKANGRLWRRGVTEADESLDPAGLSICQEIARTYTIVYLLRRWQSHYEITGLLTEGELGGGLLI